jgi:hypothetical protein
MSMKNSKDSIGIYVYLGLYNIQNLVCIPNGNHGTLVLCDTRFENHCPVACSLMTGIALIL